MQQFTDQIVRQVVPRLIFSFFLLFLVSIIILSPSHSALAEPSAAPPDWNPATGTDFADCSGINAQSDAETSSDGGTVCQNYGNDGAGNWDLYETLNYNNDANYGPARTADIQTLTVDNDTTWLYVQWDHVDAWSSASNADTHNHYLEIDTDGDEQGDFYVGWQAKVGINGNWQDADTQSWLTAEFVDGNGDVGGNNLKQSDFDSSDDGYESDNLATSDEIYARVVNGNLQIGIRWTYLGLSAAGPQSNWCLRAWTAQESTISKDKLYWHDHQQVSDLGSAKYDNLGFKCFTPTAITLSDVSGAAITRAALPIAAGLIAVLLLGSMYVWRRRAVTLR